MLLGAPADNAFELAEPTASARESLKLEELIGQALRKRPELASRRFEADAATRMIAAERALKFPAVAAVASAGVMPVHVNGIRNDNYVAAGLNISLPF